MGITLLAELGAVTKIKFTMKFFAWKKKLFVKDILFQFQKVCQAKNNFFQ